ncbi:hypothetical protein FB566_2939 [Stackebrandtia endophytica]|uniref:Uncharacterized protein n=1 Tax=Stackebrandtia endophytica TaxID=1496996 RepID=A0A543AXV9_9ACTN|nr:hypothetical protein [Stackebrandtia endophytica]TQL77380.1 hypothetical protein FB566_2939 [Stackebrandtia endophytica]
MTDDPDGEKKPATVFGADFGEWALAVCVGGVGGAVLGSMWGDTPTGMGMGSVAGIFYLLFWRGEKKESSR